MKATVNSNFALSDEQRYSLLSSIYEVKASTEKLYDTLGHNISSNLLYYSFNYAIIGAEASKARLIKELKEEFKSPIADFKKSLVNLRETIESIADSNKIPHHLINESDYAIGGKFSKFLIGSLSYELQQWKALPFVQLACVSTTLLKEPFILSETLAEVLEIEIPSQIKDEMNIAKHLIEPICAAIKEVPITQKLSGSAIYAHKIVEFASNPICYVKDNYFNSEVSSVNAEISLAGNSTAIYE
jgi:hypothetical protein